METAIVVFTRDLRLHDNPALHQACETARQVVPLFVVDPAIPAPPNRARFLAESVTDLRHQLRQRQADLIIRRGDPAAEIITLARETSASAVFIADDVSHYATRRRQRLQRECERHRLDLTLTPGLTVVPPGDLRPASGDHYKVFTPYWRVWRAARWRPHCPAPETIQMPDIEPIGALPPAATQGASPALAKGGETEGRRRFLAWRQHDLAGYPERHDDLPGDHTSRLSAYLRFGCVSPLAVALGARDRPAGDEHGEEFCRQLAWRDFFHQVTAAFPDLARKNYRPGAAWHEDDGALAAWRAGQTGIPIVDAGLRQLAAEGFMHNRARMITASFLTRNLGLDWRHGYQHFNEFLADGDVASNAGNWQWVAGTGNNTRPNRVMNPLRQAQRFDPAGDYVRRYVPELAALPAARIHTPWTEKIKGYPDPLVEL
ncbi:MAG TPA: deoxyribodipyrimidine photo-lyase [Streptosporangiaceae bacterium]|nr:deoxyribodipyrimidine photo-lyase [Streptosporangiaceae bacterium]